MRNSRFFVSESGKSLMIEISWFPRHGPRRVLRPQFPNVPATGLENAAGLYQPFWLGLALTGSTPETQLRRGAVEMKMGPAGSPEGGLSPPPLCRGGVGLACQPPPPLFNTPPRFRDFPPLPNRTAPRRE